MSWTLTTSGACISKAGLNANSSIVLSGAVLQKWSDQAEATINATTRRDWVALSGSTTTNFKGILDDVASSMVAKRIISYDMSGYTSRLEATTMLDVLTDEINKNLSILKDEKNKEEMD